jgi:hypothetical protein
MRLFLSLLLYSHISVFAGTKSKEVDLFRLPEDRCQGIAGCAVKPDTKIIRKRGVSSIFQPAKKGCCQGSEGVCGCARNQAVCCDGSTSLSCGCN